MSERFVRVSLGRAVVVALGTILLVALVLVGASRLALAPPPPPEVQATPAFGPPKTRHLLFVVVDGLRYDTATDPGLMPAFARRMREAKSAEIRANAVSMTQSAVLTYGTGQRGDVDQIVNNETGRPTPFEHWMGAARRAGLRTAATGDRAWFSLYPGAWDLEHPDPPGVSIEHDYNAEIFAAARAFLAEKPRPNVLVAHFVTPDHQAHAYGPFSERYRAHIRGFDRDLDAFLEEVPEDTTVVVTSDHGSTDTGTHGGDTEVERRSPIFAYGPGIAPPAPGPGSGPLEQIRLPTTFAALLGIPPPAHARGHLLWDWIDASDDERLRLACLDLARLHRFAGAALSPDEALEALGRSPCGPGGAPLSGDAEGASPASLAAEASLAARRLEAALSAAGPAGRASAFVVPALVALAVLGISWLTLAPRPDERRRFALAAARAIALLGLALALTFGVERLPWHGPNIARGLLFTLGNGALLVAVLRARSAVAWIDRAPWEAALFVPGLLVATQTKVTQPEAFVAAAVVVAAFGLGRPFATGAAAGAPNLGRREVLVLAAVFAAMAPAAIRDGEYLPAPIYHSEPAKLVLALATVGSWTLLRARGAARAGRPALAWIVAGGSVALASLLLRRVAPAPLCLAAWAVLAAFAPLLAARRGLAAAELFALAAYAWVSRDIELPYVAVTYAGARLFGRALGRQARKGGEREALRPSLVLLAVTFLFAWGFLQRVAVQTGIDFTHFDWNAGAFRDPGASIARIGSALAFKHGLARALLEIGVLAALPAAARGPVARGLLVAELGRVAVLVAMLFACRSSFWTSFRVLGDLPHALVAAVVAALVLIALTLRREARALKGGDERADACAPGAGRAG